ncbi:MAG: quinone-dependent dihydroorotate dehydrogenase, partial [Bacteroidota bacterium]|nr:quinone-dependent dihydroorotate dehydrogenase [Bacteroidota bacterium]
IRSLLFKFDPEAVHYFTFDLIKIFFKIPFSARLVRSLFHVNHPSLERDLFGLKFKNPVGLAAGFDKNALIYNELAHFGFGFIEVGTVTPKAQDGNPKKRLFRLKADNGLINRMGFNNAGLEALIARLKKNKNKVIVGGNIGKNNQTSADQYTDDYAQCFKALHPYVDYFVLNVSCPNVGSHAKLTDKDYLTELITEIKRLNSEFDIQKPILLKIAPDLNQLQLDEIITLVSETKIAGIIACNTSISRVGLKTPKTVLETIGMGGLSGQPIKSKSTEVIRYLSQKSQRAFPIIGVGGIHSAQDALEKIEAGADLVQIYTGFVYEGPALIKRINKALINRTN